MTPTKNSFESVVASWQTEPFPPHATRLVAESSEFVAIRQMRCISAVTGANQSARRKAFLSMHGAKNCPCYA